MAGGGFGYSTTLTGVLGLQVDAEEVADLGLQSVGEVVSAE